MSRYRKNIKTGKIEYFKSDAAKKERRLRKQNEQECLQKRKQDEKISGIKMQCVNKSTASSANYVLVLCY